jgi:hypothetical protein
VDRASRGNSFTGHPGSYIKKGSGYGHLSPQGSFRTEGNMESEGGLIDWGLYLLVDGHN